MKSLDDIGGGGKARENEKEPKRKTVMEGKVRFSAAGEC